MLIELLTGCTLDFYEHSLFVSKGSLVLVLDKYTVFDNTKRFIFEIWFVLSESKIGTVDANRVNFVTIS